MHTTGRNLRLLPLLGTLAFATALSSSASASVQIPETRTPQVLGLADVAPPEAIGDTAGPAPEALATVEPEGEELGSGMASYYGRELLGRRTASGERFDPTELTAAHRTLPFGSKVRVTNPRSGKSVVVRINDRGPFSRGRLIDVSEAAARRIGLFAMGHGQVKLTLIEG
jgi:rare lipoprotein A